MSDIFDDVADANDLEEQKPKKRAPRKAMKKAAEPVSEPDAAPVEAIVLDGKKNVEDEQYITIYIDEEAGQANYVPVGHNGTVYQIMRGIEVRVPVKVVDVLKDAIAHRVVQVVNPHTGQKENVMRPYNAVPFRVINTN